MGGAVDKVIG